MNNKYKIQFKFTDSANKKIYQLIHNNKDPNLLFRIYIIGGGCNGFQYQFKIDNIMYDNDILIKKKTIIDSISAQYLHGGTIDYQYTLEGSKFIILNPNAITTCSCGSSFSI